MNDVESISKCKERNAMKTKNREMALMCDFVSPMFHNYNDTINIYMIYSDLLVQLIRLSRFIFICKIANNESKDKILVKNLKENVWHISIEELLIGKEHVQIEYEPEVAKIKVLLTGEQFQKFINTNSHIRERCPRIGIGDIDIKNIFTPNIIQLENILDIVNTAACKTDMEIVFANGNRCIGHMTYENWVFELINGDKYTYIWPNGDKYIGDITYCKYKNRYWNDLSNYKQLRPLSKGEFTLASGEIISQDSPLFWHYANIVENDESYANATPTEIFKIAENREVEMQKKREEERLQQQREERLRQQREEEKRIKEEQEKKEKEIRRKNELILKYGQKYGTAIYNGEPQIGMTIEMVQDMHGSRGNISNYTDGNKTITKLSYGGEFVSFWGISGITKSTDYTFVNGRLTEYSSSDGSSLGVLF